MYVNPRRGTYLIWKEVRMPIWISIIDNFHSRHALFMFNEIKYIHRVKYVHAEPTKIDLLRNFSNLTELSIFIIPFDLYSPSFPALAPLASGRCVC